jgi:hypothetical protein
MIYQYIEVIFAIIDVIGLKPGYDHEVCGS